MHHLTRRNFILLAATVTALASTSLKAAAEDRVIKVGTLKLIHGITPYFYQKFAPAGFKIEVVPFESPTDGKNAVVTGSVDFGIFGLAAATLGGANGEPVVVIGAACNRGMAVVAGKDSGINSIKDLKGKKVAIWPGSTQEVVILDRLSAEGMTIKDITPVRVSFSDMAPALERGDIDAYVGAEPAAGISLAKGVGKIVEYPYSTPTGSLNMVLTTRRGLIEKDPELIRTLLKIHRKASEFAMSNREAFVEMAMQKLGQQKPSIEKAAPNVELTWNIDDLFLKQAHYYGEQMLAKKQIRQLPDYTTFIDPTFVKAISAS
ncbi:MULTISPECIES: NrtA/SsuA/CpmA family ABC transporter substrate-binding protein [Rhodopseudomonas]|uniref:ABC transporter substrate-binding protein n=1 Tax=Rhodopseudomonas palustris TaxID=1076 RepID=A0A0D7EXG0_RHOPL|nr:MULTISPECIES: NrtA/SsuA/CpmA family ABC transporter substrate-binding protein [Rhodopseudomonas]KIZ45503.1 ABC transporter substrate-binding protein [Rhodopseudomonas palustris]MDF3814444.1 NrtA/SsuA/CpmA family ABC transporter substrate-binding protein [Rhodopseudomonas sp. BAL398]WOK18892.1 NrtA/SsuA/CpmA family ABC transporter substrate-binding protein [Rhodopseudomonas sp. BAL398]